MHLSFIHDELTAFTEADNRFQKLIEGEMKSLKSYQQSDNPKKGYINRMVYLIATCSKYKKTTRSLLKQIATSNELMAKNKKVDRSAVLQSEVNRLKEENDSMRIYLRSLGGDTALLPFFDRKMI